MDDTISRKQAIDALDKCHCGGRDENGNPWIYKENAVEAIEMVEPSPSAQPYTINSDGRLWITVDDIDKVTAVVVDEHKSKFCKQFYEDYDDAQPDIIRCKDCKYWIPYDWMFSEVWQSQNIDDYPENEISCKYCDVHMKSNDFCSQAVRRTE